ncbi:MAG: hypothetical protein GTN93_33460, partial [Anaerolineae bacterium]|nr:hypothetical protein [Anaerolineae bacterium]
GMVLAGPTSEPTAEVFLELGVNTITLTVDDGNLLSDTDMVVVTVEDNFLPVISVGAEPIELWSPNHDYHTVALNDLLLDVTDSCDTDLTGFKVKITSASSDEPEDSQGDG